MNLNNFGNVCKILRSNGVSNRQIRRMRMSDARRKAERLVAHGPDQADRLMVAVRAASRRLGVREQDVTAEDLRNRSQRSPRVELRGRTLHQRQEFLRQTVPQIKAELAAWLDSDPAGVMALRQLEEQGANRKGVLALLDSAIKAGK